MDNTPNAPSEFVSLYVALTEFVRRNQQTPLGQVAVQAMTIMAPAAADLLLREKLAAQALAAAPPASTEG
ncbi:MAG TPA: hypothetical protein VLZ78_02600 [Terrimesophilobacter sp.]|nr:hypothetical protein [Terrimesophilobacter sp.]